MEKLVWNQQLCIGVEVVDNAHANLFRIVGKLMELVEKESHYRKACREGLKYLEDYTMKHFSEEEAYMRSIHYKDYAKHKQIHDVFRDQTLVSLKKTLDLSDYSRAAAQRFLSVLLGWLTGHIMTEDQAITGDPSAFCIYKHSVDTDVAAQAVSQAMMDVFHIQAALADDNYTGHNTGTSFYYHLCYDIDDGGKLQILLSAEERLIRRGVGLILGVSAMHNTSMVQEISMQIFETFLHHMGKLFPSDITYQLRKEELLTKDEFRSDFMTRYPYSMLFDTRLGHFIFCARKWDAKKRK